MREFRGKSVYKGIAIGKIAILRKNKTVVRKWTIADPEKEWERLVQARADAVSELCVLHEHAVSEAGEACAMVFEVHQLLLDDRDYLDTIRALIEKQHVNAEYAVSCASDKFSAVLDGLEDEYMRGRASDIRDISDRLLRILDGGKRAAQSYEEPVILLAEDLSPSETVQLEKDKMLAFVTREGSAMSHTAILARSMNIPALVQVKYEGELNGVTAVVDGYEGTLIIEPDAAQLAMYREKQRREEKKQRLLEQLKGKDNVTKSGQRIDICANIGNVSDALSAISNDAGGIGLFRSEFLYLEKSDYPTEEEQLAAYRAVAELMGEKRVIIRTMDIGADKKVDYFKLKEEENPAMGYRAIRICLDRQEVFRTQLRAIFRAGAYGNIWVMYPMIVSVEEVRQIKQIAEEVKRELDREGIPCGDVRQGVMIETPAAALISDLLAKEVDFFSIGTNDLTQYTLAADRQNELLDSVYNEHHEAVLRLIRMTVQNGHREGCYVGICGELAADMELTESFLEMGVDELSVSPAFVLPLREKVRSLHIVRSKTDDGKRNGDDITEASVR